jgi:phospholipid/cholesterol/gamma-HCH transport system permease protein
MTAALTTDPPARYELAPDDGSGTLRLVLSGSWRLHGHLPAADAVDRELAARAEARRVVIDAAGLQGWDSGLMTFLLRLERLSALRQVALEPDGLPEGALRLLRLATAVPEHRDAGRDAAPEPLLARIGRHTQHLGAAALDVLGFLGDTTLAFGRLLRGRASFRRVDFLFLLQAVGAQALPIVSLISFLVGVILAFLGAIQLVQFGAQIYVADLVAIGTAREMAPMMVGIILAGRSGAAFAAELGTMQANEEIDALGTFGLSAIDFLVLPRILALVLMTPLLCLYADLLGILGGALIGVTLLDLPAPTWFQQTAAALHLNDLAGGLLKATVYGALVAFAGCLRGMQCGRSSAAVGIATTSAVVTSIVLIILAMATLTVIYHALGV